MIWKKRPTETDIAALSSKLTVKNITNSPTWASHITNVDLSVRSVGGMITGYCIFAYDSSFSGGTGIQEIITNANGMPPCAFNMQMPLICVAGNSSGKVGRVRITTEGKLLFWYSNVPGAASETYLIPINYPALNG